MVILLLIIGIGVIGYLVFLTSKKQLEISKKIIKEAQTLESQVENDPFNIYHLKEALKLYEKAYKMVNLSEYNQLIQSCKNEINQREEFNNLFKKGQQLYKEWNYEASLYNFQGAKNFFQTEEIDKLITDCLEKIELNKQFDTVLEASIKLAKNGNFALALTQFKTIYEKFKHPKGQQFIDKLNRIITGKSYWQQGLYYEVNNDNNQAIYFYKKTLEYLPEIKECYESLGVLYFKENQFDFAIKYLQNIETETAKYYLGLIYAKQGDLQTAQKEWKNINNIKVQKQRETLKIIAQRQRLFLKKNIQDFVTEDKLDNAVKTSLKFIEKYGNDPWVTDNLESHIQPLLFTQNWQAQNWEKIVTETEKIWLENKDIASLHNYAIALYYSAQKNNNQLTKLIGIWLTCLANIYLNPALKNIRWLGIKTINLEEISTKLKELIERQIDEYKETNLDKYFQLRDIYRQEMLALKLIKDSSNSWIKIKEMYITPGCYETYSHKLPVIIFPKQIWGALYTDWGKAVAACIENDLKRAISIKPLKNPVSEAEYFAHNFVNYYEGSYHLQQFNWHKAKTILTEIKQELKNNSEWRANIDRLCQKQRQEIDNFNIHLEFSNFWYQLLESKASKTYYVDYKARDIAAKLADEKISINTGLSELRKLKQIDSDNLVIIDLIKRIEFIEESQKIERLMKNGNYSEAVRQAKLSNNYEIRFNLAKIFIDVMIQGIKHGELDLQGIIQLGRWAYELCPQEPAFQPVYKNLRIPY